MNYITLLDLETKEFFQLSIQELVGQYIGIFKSTIGMKPENEVYQTLKIFIEQDLVNKDLNDLQVLQDFCSELNRTMAQYRTDEYFPFVLMPTNFLFKTNAKHYVNGDCFIKKPRPKTFSNIIFFDNSYPTIKQFINDLKAKKDNITWPSNDELKRLLKL